MKGGISKRNAVLIQVIAYGNLPEDATPTGSSSIETREDGLKCAKLFRENRERIDGIIVSLPNFGFEIGIINAISVADLNVPVLVQACDDENDKVTIYSVSYSVLLLF